MKILALTLSTFLPLSALAGHSVQLRQTESLTTLQIAIDRESAIAERLADVLIQSPEVAESKDPWVKPRTVFLGRGFTLNVGDTESGQIELFLTLKAAETKNLSVSGAFASAAASEGAIKNLHHAMLVSRSKHAITASSSNRKIEIGQGDVAVLETDTFSGSAVLCGPSFSSANLIHCQIDLTK